MTAAADRGGESGGHLSLVCKTLSSRPRPGQRRSRRQIVRARGLFAPYPIRGLAWGVRVAPIFTPVTPPHSPEMVVKVDAERVARAGQSPRRTRGEERTLGRGPGSLER